MRSHALKVFSLQDHGVCLSKKADLLHISQSNLSRRFLESTSFPHFLSIEQIGKPLR
jgi:hypothetical protein